MLPLLGMVEGVHGVVLVSCIAINEVIKPKWYLKSFVQKGPTIFIVVTNVLDALLSQDNPRNRIHVTPNRFSRISFP